MIGCYEDRESLGLPGAFLWEINFINEVKVRFELVESLVLFVVIETDIFFRGNDAI